MEPTTENLDEILRKLLSVIPEVKAATIVSAEGLPIASALPQGVDETRIAAMTAALLHLAEKSVIEMKKGKFDQLYIKGSDGYLLVLQAGSNAVLTISMTKGGRIIFRDFDNYITPYPSIPPDPPGGTGSAKSKVQLIETKEKLGFKPHCKHCGAELPKGQSICHACKNMVI